MDLSNLEVKELLKLQSSIIDELKKRKIVRTKNNPVGDYTEWLVAKGLGLELANNSSAGYDAIDTEGKKYQIKGRRITPDNKSRQLSALRNYEEKDFDYLVAVIFNENYEVIEARMIPHEIIGDYSKYREHVNAHILHLKGAILENPRVTSIVEKISS
ncbi:MAG: hypothetical protein JAY99_01735 [Candidatus Thiodiazotropha lotti]|nr:hypothetical protein [Candidatus Thiodiazotropha lotti]MCG7998223.1 hypothetical protein [Candidatus Thiodiazotropha lotti]MCW4182852.1 hypothetical protein [Candidatus Thiodiazotropha weberae]MCW4189989.1 hypothetical protein [Candidatus Thiodiazotropha weberae]